MVGFHHPRDPYFSNQGNVGWLDAESEDEPAIPLDDELAEDFPEDQDSEPEVEDLPLEAPVKV